MRKLHVRFKTQITPRRRLEHETKVYNTNYKREWGIKTMVYRSLRGLAPNYLSSKFETREVAYNLRDSENKLNVPLPRTNYYKNSFSYSGAILWNSLPSNLREAESLGQFKRLLKEL